MPDYRGCRIRLGVPTAYRRTDEAVQYLRNKMPGVNIEVVTTDKVGPEISEVEAPPGFVPETGNSNESAKGSGHPAGLLRPEPGKADPAESLMLLVKGWLDEFLLPSALQ